MARKKTAEESRDAKARLAGRLRAVRVERFGERGGPDCARRLGVPTRTWYNYEVGVTVPAEVLLRFLEVTGASPRWLLDGLGPVYREVEPGVPPEGPTPRGEASSLAGLVEALLGRLGRGSVRLTWEVDEAGGPVGPADR